MTTIATRYIASTVMTYILLALLLVVGIDLIFAFVRELKYTSDHYSIIQVLEYLMLTVPRRVYGVFPMSSLLGAVMGLGLLASHSELIVMRAAGLSLMGIVRAVLQLALILAVFLVLVGEFLLPKTEYWAESLRATSRGNAQATLTAQGAWVKDGNFFIHIDKAFPGGYLSGVTRYEVNDDQRLVSVVYSDHAQLEKGAWQLKQASYIDLQKNPLQQQQLSVLGWSSTVAPNLLAILVSDPENLSLRGLASYIQYLKENHLDASIYQLNFWQKIFQPFSLIVMLFLAVIFIFGPLRTATLGLRLLAGVITGFGFYIVNQVFGPFSLVYHWPPALAAILPSVLFALLGLVILKSRKV